MAWISVDDKLPDNGKYVLVYNGANCPVHSALFICEDGEAKFAKPSDTAWYEDTGRFLGVTHWMPFPKPPKE